ncbi:MAG TPA: hypothetical protein VLE22_18520 [Bryobacteraceae bacterium]|nr:hypothetical protein [Bryobacteraceae bacterium]
MRGVSRVRGHTVRPDGTLRDANSIPRGHWEAKDSRDYLAREIERKIRRGYPLTNTIFEDTVSAVLYQNRDRRLLGQVIRVSLDTVRPVRSLPVAFSSA